MSKDQHTVKIKLKFPIKWSVGPEGEKLIEEIEFRRPKGKHIKKLNKDVDMDTLIKIAAKVAVEDLTPAFFDELDGVDYIAVTEVIGDFLDDGRETGRTS